MMASDTMSLSAMIIVTVFLMVLGAFALSSSLLSKILRRNRKRLPGGLHVRHDPKDARFEIVAVHGLGANPEYTWTCKAESPGSGGNSRVHLLDLLAKQFPNARIMNFAHYSEWLIDASISTAQESGSMLSRQLVSHREKSSSNLPIVFIGHSFGGIIIKQALDSLTAGDPWGASQKQHAKDFMKYIRGILFLGTPHRGSSLSSLAYPLARATHLLGSETGLLLLLLKDSSQLSDIADKFENSRQRLTEAKVYSFYEQKKTYIGHFSVGTIVNKESARGLTDYLIPVNTDHSGLNKCCGLTDPIFLAIKNAIEEVTTTVPPTLSRADKCILDIYATDKRLRIQRLSGGELSMDDCYINLNIVQRSSQQDQYVDQVPPPTSDLSIRERLRMKELKDGAQIRLHDLFRPRKIHDEKEERPPKRILIRGRPGVGKSTLCKKIIHDFVRLKQNESSLNEKSEGHQNARRYTYCRHFERILWVPLRNLAARKDASHWKWLLGIYFTQMQHSEAESMVEALRVHLQSSRTDDTLFLLDGMDEIVAELKPESPLKEMVDWLLGQRNVIVTSRPYVKFNQSQERENFDIELETIGFYQDQVKDYVAKVEQPVAAQILEFLRNRPLIQDLVRIPVQLDALCFAWKDAASRNMKGKFALETMTGLYQAVEGALWRKDSFRLDRTSESDTPLPSEIEKIMKGEIALLENLAFHGLCEGLTVFNEHFLERVFKELQEELQPLKGLDYTLQRLSFLRSSEVSPGQTRRNYYFLHLTHQEYFAARYLKRQWIEQNADGVDAIAFFRGHKYSEKFDIVWRFLSGLLGSHGERYSQKGSRAKHEYGSQRLEIDQLERYFKEIRQEPLDMLGLTHQRLVMRCLFEVPTSRSLPGRENLEKQLENWLLFEYYFRQEMSYHREWLADNIEFPEHIIERLLTDGGDDLRARLLQSLKPRHMTRPEIISLVTSWLEQKDGPVLRESISMFETFPETSFSEKVIRTFTEKLDDPDSGVRDGAVKVVRRMMESPTLSQLALEEMMRALDLHHDSFIKTRVLDDHHALLFETDLEMIHTSVSRPSGKLLLKVARVVTSLPRQEYGLTEESRQKRLEEAVLKILFANQISSPPSVSSILIKWVQNSDLIIHNNILYTLGQQPDLRLHLMENAMKKFKSDDPSLCSTAVKVLNTQQVLPESIRMELIENAMEKFKSDNPRLCSIAIDFMNTQPAPPESIRIELMENAMEKFKSGDPNLRSTAIEVLNSQRLLSEAARMEMMKTAMEMFKSDNPELRSTAIEVLNTQSVLPEAISIELIQMLMIDIKTPDLTRYLRLAKEQKIVLEILERQNRLQDAVLRALVQLLSSGCNTAKECARSILQNQSKLSGTILDMLARLVETGDCKCQEEIRKIFRKNSGLPESTFQILAQGLQHENPKIQETALQALPAEQHLPDRILRQVVDLLMSKHRRVVDSALHVLQGCQKLHMVLDQINCMLEVKDKNTRKRALEIFEHRNPSNEIFSQIVLPTEDEDPCIRKLALMIFLRSVDGSKYLMKIEMMLGDECSSIREHALETVIFNKLTADLSDAALDKVARILKADTRARVGNVLRGAKRLTPTLTQLVTEKLEDADTQTKVIIIDALTGMKTMPQVIIDCIQRKLRDPDRRVRSAALNLFCVYQNLFPLAIEVLEKGLQDKDFYLISKAVERYLCHQSLPESLPPIVLQILNSKRDGPKLYARCLLHRQDTRVLDVFPLLKSSDTCQSDHPMSLLEFMAHNLGNDEPKYEEYLRGLARRKFKFPVEVLDIILRKLEGNDNSVQDSARRIIEEVHDWPEDKHHQTLANQLLLADKHWAEKIFRILSKQPRLSSYTLTHIATFIRKHPSGMGRSLLIIMREHPEIATIWASDGDFPLIYRFLLEISLDKHLVWLHQSNDLGYSDDQSQWCYRTMGEDVKKELMKARQDILGWSVVHDMRFNLRITS